MNEPTKLVYDYIMADKSLTRYWEGVIVDCHKYCKDFDRVESELMYRLRTNIDNKSYDDLEEGLFKSLVELVLREIDYSHLAKVLLKDLSKGEEDGKN